jgi:hypothetical protein
MNSRYDKKIISIIRFSKRDPFFANDDVSGKLLVALYAWDGNSFPGNEFWSGQMGSTGDSAAACCTQVNKFKTLSTFVSLSLFS